MAIPLRQSTAGQHVQVGPYQDVTGAFLNALTFANTDLRVSKNGAVPLVDKNSGGATFLENGAYDTTWNDTDTNTCGSFVIYTAVATSITGNRTECIVYPQNVFDSFFAGTDQVSVEDIAAEVVIEMDATSTKLTDILSGVVGMPAAIDDVITDGTITWAQQKFYTLSVLQGDATGLLGANKDFMNQDGDPAVSSVHSGGTRTVTLTPP